jgi:hypothetical protein
MKIRSLLTVPFEQFIGPKRPKLAVVGVKQGKSLLRKTPRNPTSGRLAGKHSGVKPA